MVVNAAAQQQRSCAQDEEEQEGAAAAKKDWRALQKALKHAKKEIEEYEALVALLDSTGKLDALLREAVAATAMKRKEKSAKPTTA